MKMLSLATLSRVYLLGQMACPIGRVKDFVIEDRKVERQAQPNRMCGRHFRLCYIKCLLVCLLGALHRGCCCCCEEKKPKLIRNQKKKKLQLVGFPPQWKMKCNHKKPNRFGQLTGFLWRVEDFIVEDWEVERQSQPDGVGGLHLWLADVVSVLISLLGVIHYSCKKVLMSTAIQPHHDRLVIMKWPHSCNTY